MVSPTSEPAGAAPHGHCRPAQVVSRTSCWRLVDGWVQLTHGLVLEQVFLPQLLTYPNPTDPLNGEAASLAMRDLPAYHARIRSLLPAHLEDTAHLEESSSPRRHFC